MRSKDILLNSNKEYNELKEEYKNLDIEPKRTISINEPDPINLSKVVIENDNIIKECDITKDDIAKIFTDPNYIKKLDFSDYCTVIRGPLTFSSKDIKNMSINFTNLI